MRAKIKAHNNEIKTAFLKAIRREILIPTWNFFKAKRISYASKNKFRQNKCRYQIVFISCKISFFDKFQFCGIPSRAFLRARSLARRFFWANNRAELATSRD